MVIRFGGPPGQNKEEYWKITLLCLFWWRLAY
jgi:hypothetical protein